MPTQTGPAASADCAEMQRDATLVLAELLAETAEQDLPTLTWKLDWTGVLIGRPNEAASPEERREVFHRWVAYLGTKHTTFRTGQEETLLSPWLRAPKAGGASVIGSITTTFSPLGGAGGAG